MFRLYFHNEDKLNYLLYFFFYKNKCNVLDKSFAYFMEFDFNS